MNKISKFLILIGVCLAFIAIIISAGNFQKLFEPFYSDEHFEYTNYTTDGYKIDKLIVNTNNDRVTIKSYQGTEIRIQYPDGENYKYTINNSNGILTLVKPNSVFKFRFRLHFNFRIPEIIIEIPEELELAYDINSDNAYLKINDLKILDSIFNTDNGRIEFTNINSNGMHRLQTTNARITLNNVDATQIIATTNNGKIEANNITANKIAFKTSNAKISFSNLNSQEIDIKTSNGSIKGWIAGHAEDYHKIIDTSNGRITINGEEHGKRYSDSISSYNKLDAKSTNGSIYIDFK